MKAAKGGPWRLARSLLAIVESPSSPVAAEDDPSNDHDAHHGDCDGDQVSRPDLDRNFFERSTCASCHVCPPALNHSTQWFV